ncbi:hypothetical protein, partial [Bauldia litoralis]|uniref:hypothetical protein n=1 Tax=Bauldia litoralis TaxID=665467 RepID=UPI0032643237
MTATTIRQSEALPEAYPDAPESLSTAAAAIADTVWQRIESYVAHRWTPRNVMWIVEGPGEWAPPLTPATFIDESVWQDDAWAAVALSPSPLGGFVLPGCGPYRIDTTVGDTEDD